MTKPRPRSDQEQAGRAAIEVEEEPFSPVARGLGLPIGMRDALQEEISEERALGRAVSRTFALYGYEEVGLPAFEYLDVISRGLGHVGPELLLRFVEPETGHIVALRPDMTPQVARLIASRWPDAPRPLRLSYLGNVLRRRPERARHDIEVVQCGIELVGDEGLEADLEVISATLGAVRAAGLKDFVVDLAHGGIAHGLLSGVSGELRAALLADLARKDQSRVASRAERGGLERELVRTLAALPELQGGVEVIERARALPGFAPALPFVLELSRLGERVARAEDGPRVVFDLGETRPVPYYTGMMFQVLAEGPGQAVASGGRYDELYARFGVPRAAAGAAVNIDHLAWAVSLGRKEPLPRLRVLVFGAAEAPTNDEGQKGLATLRAQGIPAAPLFRATSRADALEYARLGNYSFVAEMSGGASVVLYRTSTQAEVARGTFEQVAQFIVARSRAGDPAFGALHG